MEIIADTLGLNLTAFLWHTANYALLLLALWWVGFRPVMRKLAQREQEVRDSLERADQARAAAVAAEGQRAAHVAAAQQEAAAILDAARTEAARILADAATTAGACRDTAARRS